MAIFTCKICGGMLETDGTLSVAVCTHCGTKQTLPRADDEKKNALYERAERLRRSGDFTRAMALYEELLTMDAEDADLYWAQLLCRYGIEYVEDPQTHKRMPTVRCAQYTSLFDDEAYRSAIRFADPMQREVYEAEGREINRIQKEFLAISQKEEPFDVFICYKESDGDGKRTPDSVLAQEVYAELKREGYKVFFSRVTLEGKLGTAYEPYIFSALHSAKVMVVVGTNRAYFESVWVRNEWSRYLALIKNGEKKLLIPAYRSMSAYDLPAEFSHLQALNMEKLGFMQDLLGAIAGYLKRGSEKKSDTAPMLQRIYMALSDRNFALAYQLNEQLLNQDPENAEAYLAGLLISLSLRSEEELAMLDRMFHDNYFYKKAYQFGDEALRARLEGYLKTIWERNESRRKGEIYTRALSVFGKHASVGMYEEAIKDLRLILPYRDSEEKIVLLEERIVALKEQLAKEQEEKAKKRALARQAFLRNAKKVAILSLITLFAASVIGVVSWCILHLVIPAECYQDALQKMEEAAYSEAETLLLQAKEDAFREELKEKIDQTEKLLTLLTALHAFDAETGVRDSAQYEEMIREFLQAGVAVELRYELNGGSSDDGETRYLYQGGDTLEGLPAVHYTGYLLLGYTSDFYFFDASDNPLCWQLAVNWDDAVYDIRYHLDGGSVSGNPSVYGLHSDAITLKAPTKTGYTFLGWTGSGLTTPTLSVTIESGSYGSRTYTANWQANTYQITLDAAGGTSEKTKLTVRYDEQYTLPRPQKDHYGFSGWFSGDEKIMNGYYKKTEDLQLVARWTVLHYNVVYQLDGVPCENPNPKFSTVESDAIVLLPLASTEYATFLGWYRDAAFTTPITEIPKALTENLTQYAKWDFKTYTIRYLWNGGEEVTSALTSYTYRDLPLTLPKPEKENHEFLYWTEDSRNGSIVLDITVCRDYTIYGNYLIDGMSFNSYSSTGGVLVGVSYQGDAKEIEVPHYSTGGAVVQRVYSIRSQTLESITLPDSIIQISSIAFQNCTALQSITLPEGLQWIGNSAFAGCQSLRSIEIPKTVTTFGATVFARCDALTLAEYDGNDYVGDASNPYRILCQVNDKNKSTHIIHEKTELIADEAFYGARALVKLVIPENVVSIGEDAFDGCAKLVEIYNLSALDIHTFDWENGEVARHAKVVHTSLDEASCLGTEGDFMYFHNPESGYSYLVAYLGSATDVVLPETLHGTTYRVIANAFCDKTNITRLTVGAGVEVIEADVFDDLSLLTAVNFIEKNGWQMTSSSGSITKVSRAELVDEVDALALVLTQPTQRSWQRFEE